jgi:hypothetical protein
MQDPTGEPPKFGRGYYLSQEINKVLASENMVDVSEALLLIVSMWAVNLHPEDDERRERILQEFERRVRVMTPIFKEIAKANPELMK